MKSGQKSDVEPIYSKQKMSNAEYLLRRYKIKQFDNEEDGTLTV